MKKEDFRKTPQKTQDKMLKNSSITENPIIEPVAAISAGILKDEILLDLDYSEDSSADVDANLVMTASGKIIEFGSTAEGNPFYQDQLIQLLEVGQKGINEIIELQKEALLNF